MKHGKTAKTFFVNVVLLTASSFFMHSVGLAFQVYLSSKIGAEGIGLFQLIMSVYSLSVTLALSGIRLAVIRLVSMEMALGNTAGANRVINRAMLCSLTFGSGAGILLYNAAQSIGLRLLGNPDTIASLRILAVSLPFVALTSCISGYFIALRGVGKNIFNQIFGQLCRIILTVFCLSLLLPRGLKYACIAIVLGSVIAEILSFFSCLLFYLYERSRHKDSGAPRPGTTKRVLGIALPIALSSYVRTGLSTAESLLTPVGLKKSGISPELSLSAYGRIRGMAMPVLLFPAAFLHALSDLLIPELSECHVQQKRTRIHYIIRRVFGLTALFSIAVMGILLCFSREISMLIYKNTDVAIYIKLLAPLIPVMYIDEAVDAMLKGLGQQLSSMRYNIIDALMGLIMIVTILPKFAIPGYIATIYATELVNFLLSTHRLIRVSECSIDLWKSIFKPAFGITGSICLVKLVCRSMQCYASSFSELSLQILAVLAIYCLFLAISSCVTREDVKWFTGIFKSSSK